jgi:hypothetical protein
VAIVFAIFLYITQIKFGTKQLTKLTAKPYTVLAGLLISSAIECTVLPLFYEEIYSTLSKTENPKYAYFVCDADVP